MKVLILDAENSIAYCLAQLFAEQERVECATVSRAKLTDIDELITQYQPDFVVNCHTSECVVRDKLDSSHVDWIAKLVNAVGNEGALLHVSSAQVFDGSSDQAYAEDDEPTPTQDLGDYLFSAEKIIQQSISRSFILRSGWVFGSEENSFLDRLLNHIERGGEIKLHASMNGAPTPAADIARVLNTVLWQLYYGAYCWDVYHYCGSEVTTSMMFTDTLIALASQYGDLNLDHTKLIEAEEFELLGITQHPLISCEKILEAFGIKQKSWRPSLTSIVKHRYSTEAK